MIFDDSEPYAIVLDAGGGETGNIVPWLTGNASWLAYQADGYALQVNSGDEPLVDFRRLPGRVWQSSAGQEIRVFQTDPGAWQYSVAGMDISDGEYHDSEAGAIEAAKAAGTVPWSEDGNSYPRWADLIAGTVIVPEAADDAGTAGALARALAGASPQDIVAALRTLDAARRPSTM